MDGHGDTDPQLERYAFYIRNKATTKFHPSLITQPNQQQCITLRKHHQYSTEDWLHSNYKYQYQIHWIQHGTTSFPYSHATWEPKPCSRRINLLQRGCVSGEVEVLKGALVGVCCTWMSFLSFVCHVMWHVLRGAYFLPLVTDNHTHPILFYSMTQK